jgi:hypothetical protein
MGMILGRVCYYLQLSQVVEADLVGWVKEELGYAVQGTPKLKFFKHDIEWPWNRIDVRSRA